MAYVHSLDPQHTYLLGIIPHLPTRLWYSKYIGPSKLFKCKKLFPINSHLFVRTRAKVFVQTPAHALHHLDETKMLASPCTCDMVVIEA